MAHIFSRDFSTSKSGSSNDHGFSDRFIPSGSSHKTYHHGDFNDSFSSDSGNSSISHINFSLREEFLFAARTADDVPSVGNTTDSIIDNDQLSSTSTHVLHANRNSASPLSHQGIIADALGFGSHSRVLTFSPSRSRSSHQSRSRQNGNQSNKSSNNNSAMDISGPLLSNLSPIEAVSAIASKPESSNGSFKPKKRVKSHIPYRVLDAPGLRNDFYANLVSWSKSTGKVAVGLGIHIYLWNEESGAVALKNPQNEIITCVAFSNEDFLVVGTKNGRILLYSLIDEELKTSYIHFEKSICVVSWFDDSRRFFVGDEFGEVLYFEVEIEQESGSIVIDLKTKFKSHQQQVCGIALNNSNTQVAIGGNDNCCTVWSISDISSPTLKYVLPHQAAVKAIAYCPWSKSLLATGGGSKDRTIRFWHTNSGTLLDAVNVKGQITSLIWSRTMKQLVATFGFGDVERPILVAVYSYPKMQPLVQVQATFNLRVLSAVSSPDSNSICVATNDETVRFYELWPASKPNLVSDVQSVGVFGSDIIELCEGIDKGGDIIR